jgi:hypothetical protein
MGNTATEKRNRGQRRWGLEPGFPLKDSNGVLVIGERRNLSDRRLGNISMEERMVMFSGMPPIDIE